MFYLQKQTDAIFESLVALVDACNMQHVRKMTYDGRIIGARK